jgi:hypothetical protein
MNPQRLLTLRIIHAALLLGCVSFGAVIVFIRLQQQQPLAPNPPMLSYIGIAVAVSTVLAFLIVPSMLLNGWRRRLARGESPFPVTIQPAPAKDDDDAQYATILQTHFIIRAALLEGTIFYQLIAYLVEGQPWTLGLAVFFWLVLLAKFPTDTGTRRWIEAQRDQVELLRKSGT